MSKTASLHRANSPLSLMSARVIRQLAARRLSPTPMNARRDILSDGAISHVFFRCHNRQHFLKPRPVRNFLLLLWALNKDRYKVKVIDFNLMDNHAHLILKANSTGELGDFMRTVNSQLARFINKFFDRDSQAIRERYKSPEITSDDYLTKTIQYVYMNRVKIDPRSRPDRDPYCSASWRLNPGVSDLISSNEEEKKLLRSLLDPYDSTTPLGVSNPRKFVRDLLNAALSRMGELSAAVFTHSHTIGDPESVASRARKLFALRRAHLGIVRG